MATGTETAFTPKELEEALNIAWRDGRLTYLMRNTQRVIRDAWDKSKEISRKFYLECTRRLGKSSLLLILMTEECKKNDRHKCVYFAPVKEGLLDYIEPIIDETYADCPVHLRPLFVRQRFMLLFSNGSRILFRAANNKQYRTRRGLGAHLIGVDEAREIDDLADLVDSVIMPALFDKGGYLIISSTPADKPSHPLYNIRKRAQAESWFISISIWDANRLDPDVYTLDRIREWKEEMLASPDGQERWEREFEVKWVVNKSKLAIPEWDSSKYVMDCPRDPYYNFYHHYLSVDWGYRDYTALVFATMNFRKARLEYDSELTFSGTEVRSDIISGRIRGMYRGTYGLELYDKTRHPQVHTYRQVSDSADPILINEMNKYDGMSFVPVQKGDTLDAMLQEFRVLVMKGKIVVSPKCSLLIYCLENGAWNDKRDKLDNDILAHHFDHLMAAVYLARMVDWEVNPIPKDYMLDNVRVIDINFDKTKAEGNSARALEGAFKGKRRW